MKVAVFISGWMVEAKGNRRLYKDIIELISLKIGDIGVIVSKLKKDGKHLVSFLDIESKLVICIRFVEEMDMKIWEKQNTNRNFCDGIPLKPYNNVMLMNNKKPYINAGIKKVL